MQLFPSLYSKGLTDVPVLMFIKVQIIFSNAIAKITHKASFLKIKYKIAINVAIPSNRVNVSYAVALD